MKLIVSVLFIGAALCQSRLAEKDPKAQGFVTLFEGNSGSQNVVCNLSWDVSTFWNFQDFSGCQNDEARSAIIEYAKAGTTITIYDSPAGAKDDDYTIIKIRNDIISPILITSFEQNLVGDGFEMTYHADNGLDGKVSRIEIDIFKREHKSLN